MATNQRIRGSDAALVVTAANVLMNTFQTISNFENTFKFEKLVERYIGEQSVRTDEIFAGVEGKLKLHVYDEQILAFITALQSRAQRITPTAVFNHAVTLNFPNQEAPVVTFPDVNYGDVPMTGSNGKDYISFDLDFVGATFDLQL